MCTTNCDWRKRSCRKPYLPLQGGLCKDWRRAGAGTLRLLLLLAALTEAPEQSPVALAVAAGQPAIALRQPTLQSLRACPQLSPPQLNPLTQSSFGKVWLPFLAWLLLRGCQRLLTCRILFLGEFWFFLTFSILFLRSWRLFQEQFQIRVTKMLLGFSVLPSPAASPRRLTICRKTITGKGWFVQTGRTGWHHHFWLLLSFYWRIRILFFVLSRCRLSHLVLENKTMLVNLQSYLVLSPILTF